MIIGIAAVITAIRGYQRDNSRLQQIAFNLAVATVILMGISIFSGNLGGILGVIMGLGAAWLSRKNIHPKRLKYNSGE